MNTLNYKPVVCEHCHQTISYLCVLDKGAVDITKAIAAKIRNKGVNCVHPRNEMEIAEGRRDYIAMAQEGLLTSNQVGNLSKARFHGLIAKVKIKGKNTRGNYCLTTKGAQFLKGKLIDKYAEIKEGHNQGYYEPGQHMISVKSFKGDGAYWEGIDFEIIAGEIILDINTYKKAKQGSLGLNLGPVTTN